MDKKTLGIIILSLVLVIGIVVVISYTNSNQERIENKEETTEMQVDEENKKYNSTNEVVAGELAPNFTLKNLDGEDVSLSDYRGKNVLVNFWSTQCKYCDIEMPDLNDIDRENEDIVVLAVDVMEDESTVRNYIEKGGYGFEVVLDKSGDIARQYLISGFPTTYVVDKEGILVGRVPGMMTREQMEQLVESVRTEK